MGIGLILSIFNLNVIGQGKIHLSKKEGIQDIRHLIRLIESVHPDPYIYGGGKIAFHRRLHRLLHKIPAQGISQKSFYNLLCPFVAAIGDSHTAIRLPEPEENLADRILPLGFKIIEENLILNQVPQQKYQAILGSILLSVEGVAVSELIKRQDRRRGMENLYGKLAYLVYFSLRRDQALRELVPEWKNPNQLRIRVKFPDGKDKTVTFSKKDLDGNHSISLTSKIDLPSTKKSDIAFDFLDKERKIGLLVINNMMRYREGCETWFSDGLMEAETYTRMAYKQIHKQDPPKNRQALLAGIPSATETFMRLVADLKRSESEYLIVDLRNNTGGNSVMSSILIYFLYGDKAMRRYKGGYSVTKFSPLLLRSYGSINMAEINRNRTVPLTEKDYDFNDEFQQKKKRAITSEEAEKWAQKSATFWKTYKTKRYHRAAFKLKRVIVLCSPLTFSSGFNMMTDLYFCGAILLGTPSGQPGNNFGDVISTTLNHSQIKVFLPYKGIFTFPDDPEKGRCLDPHIKLTYGHFVSYGFDANSEVLLALDLLKK
jgi:hypothetical protein